GGRRRRRMSKSNVKAKATKVPVRPKRIGNKKPGRKKLPPGGAGAVVTMSKTEAKNKNKKPPEAADIPVRVAAVTDVEPTAEQLAAEQTLIDEEIQARKTPGRQAPAPGKDLLASYMEQLSHIPLFTPDQ